MESYYLISLRLLHITAGTLWVGAAFYLVVFIMPAVQTLGREGGRFMQQLAKTNNLPMMMKLLSFITIASGLLVLYAVSGGFNITWVKSTHGITLLLGGLLALIAYTYGLIVIGPTVKKFSMLGQSIEQAGSPPTMGQTNMIGQLRKKIMRTQQISFALLAVSLLIMSIIRYV